jgi:serine/threonine-protein kinase
VKSILGETLRDRYRIVQELSKEDWSKVYLAEDRNNPSNPQCEIERFHPYYDGEVLGSQSWQRVRQLFFTEAEKLQKLSQNPQIPQVWTYFEEERDFYLVKEIINGETLAAKIKRQPLNEDEAIVWLKEILNILDVVHQQSIIHLNIQPSSLIQQRLDGKIFLTNFGSLRTSISLLKNEFSFASLKNKNEQYFLAPEQKQNRPIIKSDFYGLGKTIIYALTGKYSEIINSESEVNKQNLATGNGITSIDGVPISSQLISILKKMVAESPAERYESVTEILDELGEKQNVVTLPPPFVINNSSYVAPAKANINSSQPRFKINKITLWGLLILPFIGALITLFIGINKNMYRGFLSYTNQAYNFTIKYPENWSLKELDDPITGEVAVFTSPLESESDLFLERVYLSVEYLSSQPTTLDEYTEIVFEKIQQEKGNEIEVYEEKKTRLDRHPARIIIYSRNERGLLLRQMEAFTIKNDRVYIIIYTAQRVKFSKFFDTAQKMLKSWEIQ